MQFTDHTIHPLKTYNSGFQYIHRYGQPSPQPITEHFHSLKNKPCALFSQPLTSLNPLAQGEHEPSFCLGSGTRRASFRARPHSGAQCGAVGGGAGLRASAAGNSAQAAGKTRQSPHPQGGGGRRKEGTGPSSHLHGPRTWPRQRGAGMGGERLPPCFSWEDSLQSRERGALCSGRPRSGGGLHPAE